MPDSGPQTESGLPTPKQGAEVQSYVLVGPDRSTRKQCSLATLKPRAR